MKRLNTLIAILLTLSLAACGTSQQTSKENGGDQQTTNKKTDGQQIEKKNDKKTDTKKQVTAIIQKATGESNSIHSMEMNLSIKQNISNPNKQNIHSSTSMKADMTKDPFAMHATFTIRQKNNTLNQEMYLTDKAIYVKNKSLGQWIKMPSSTSNQMTQMISKKEQNPLNQLKQLRKYAENFTVKKQDDNYVLHFSANGKDFLDLAKENLNPSLSSNLNANLLDSIKLNKLAYTFVIDQKDYHPKKLKMTMDMNMAQEDNKFHIVSTTNGTYSKINKIGKITVPQKVIKNATKMPDLTKRLSDLKREMKKRLQDIQKEASNYQ